MMFGGRLAEMWCRDACVPILMPMESTRQRGGAAAGVSMIRVAPPAVAPGGVSRAAGGEYAARISAIVGYRPGSFV